MNSYRKAFWVTMVIFGLLMLACVTINIYFPAEKVESAAKEIVNEIRGPSEEGDKQNFRKNEEHSLVLKTLLALSCSSAYAENITEVSNPTIRALKDRMKARYSQLRPYYQKGILKEGDDGYVTLESDASLNLKEKRDLKNLVSAENQDRRALYAEVAKALKIDPNQTEKVAEIFAKEWQKTVR